MKRLLLLLLPTVIVLGACASDDPDDGLVGDTLTSPLSEIEEYLETGNGEALCRHLDFYFANPCSTIPLFSQGLTPVGFEIYDTPSGQIFAFSDRDFNLTVERTDSEFDGESVYIWSVRELEFPYIDLPYGSTYAGLEAGGGARFMPGSIDQALLEVPQDSFGLWMPNLNLIDGELTYEVAPDASDKATDLFKDYCDEFSSNLTSDVLLEDAWGGFFRINGEDDNAQTVAFVSGDSDEVNSRTINASRLTSSTCAVDPSSVVLNESGDSSYFTGVGLLSVNMSGEVARRTARSATGVSTYEWLPREFVASFELSMEISNYGDQTTVQNSTLAEAPGGAQLLQREHWLISEVVEDLAR